MPSHKQKKDRKKSHKSKHRNSRSNGKKHGFQKKNEGKKENIPHVSSACDGDLRDLSTYLGDRRELIKEMFNTVGEEFFAKNVPLILKNATREELKKICFEELTAIPDDVAFKILEGIPCDAQPLISAEECSLGRVHECKSPETPCGHASKPSSPLKCRKRTKSREEQQQNSDKEEMEGVECHKGGSTERKAELESAARGNVERKQDMDESLEDDTTSSKMDFPSTSCQPSMTKKLAKVAPFHISVLKPEISCLSQSEEQDEADSSVLDSDISCEIMNLGDEGDLGITGSENDSGEEASVGEVLQSSILVENSDSEEVTEEEIQQNLSEMRELKHRARAIRSMLANIDRLQA